MNELAVATALGMAQPAAMAAVMTAEKAYPVPCGWTVSTRVNIETWEQDA
jgi:hypothetical protein